MRPSAADDVGNSLRLFAEAWQEHRRHQARLLQTDPAGLDVLDHLMASGPSSPTDLAQAIGVTSAVMATTLRRLESAGHIRRESLPEDRRRVRVSVTQAFHRRSRPTAESIRTSMNEILEAMSPRDTDVLTDTLLALAGNLERSPAPPGTRYRAKRQTARPAV